MAVGARSLLNITLEAQVVGVTWTKVSDSPLGGNEESKRVQIPNIIQKSGPKIYHGYRL